MITKIKDYFNNDVIGNFILNLIVAFIIVFLIVSVMKYFREIPESEKPLLIAPVENATPQKGED